MHTEEVEFKNDSGIVLKGVLHHALGSSRAFALFAHCFTCTAKSKAAVTVSRRLATHGITVLRFDFTGLGESGGEFAESNFSTSVGDVVAAASFIETRFGRVDLGLGHSLGGTAVLAAATEHKRFAAVVTIGAPARAEHVTHLLGEAPAGSESVRVDLGGRPFTIKRQFFEDLAEQPAPSFIRKLRAALLVMHAPLDDVVEIENASDIFLHAVHPKSFVTLDNANHLLTNDADAEYAADVIVAWSSRYLPQALPATDTQWVTATTGVGFATAIEAAGHRLLGDEPTAAGGSNLGPSPYDYLSAALASCTSMTLQMYARHKQLDLRTATTRVRHQKIHAADCAECETEEGRIDQLEREIELDGDLDEAGRRRMLEIADRCPVHKTLSAEIRIVTRARD